VRVFTHDSVGLGEDGPTHQPIEHYAALRSIPGLIVIRPADANETAQAWRVAIEHRRGPVALVLTRQDVPVLAPELVADGVSRGGYVVSPATEPAVALVATGSEVSVALASQAELERDGIAARVVSMPSWELFESQDDQYRRAVLMPQVPTVSLEAGVSQGWSRWVDASISIERFGASAPGALALSRLGITPARVVERAKELLSR
jgi:transketolase